MTMLATRIQRSRRRSSRLPPGAVCVTRPSVLGNPFCGEQAIPLYRLMMRGRWCELLWELNRVRETDDEKAAAMLPHLKDVADRARGKLAELAARMARGETPAIACWCAIGKACHGDVICELLAEMVNKLEKAEA